MVRPATPCRLDCFSAVRESSVAVHPHADRRAAVGGPALDFVDARLKTRTCVYRQQTYPYALQDSRPRRGLPAAAGVLPCLSSSKPPSLARGSAPSQTSPKAAYDRGASAFLHRCVAGSSPPDHNTPIAAA